MYTESDKDRLAESHGKVISTSAIGEALIIAGAPLLRIRMPWGEYQHFYLRDMLQKYEGRRVSILIMDTDYYPTFVETNEYTREEKDDTDAETVDNTEKR